jgi:hypothetical protein
VSNTSQGFGGSHSLVGAREVVHIGRPFEWEGEHEHKIDYPNVLTRASVCRKREHTYKNRGYFNVKFFFEMSEPKLPKFHPFQVFFLKVLTA